METAGGRCPNCRRIYDSNNLDFTPPDPTLIQTEKKKKTKKKHSFSRKQLVNVRVIQRNLVYVVGLTLDVAREDVGWLRRPENFGKYGKIAKVVINKSNLSSGSRPPNVRSPTVSAYITYSRKEDAYKCIKAIDSTWLDGKLLRASFGTTKYCAYFLRGIPCTNPDCMYLHDYGDEEDTFNKEDIVLRNGLPVPHNSAKLSQFYPHLEDTTPCEKHFWQFKDSNVPPPDSFEAAYDDDDYHHHRHHDEEDEFDDIDAHDEDNNYEGEYDDPQFSSSEEDVEEYETHTATTEYAKDNFDPNGSILPSTARWGKKSPESKSKKKKKKSKGAKQPQPIPIQPPPLDANNAWTALSKAKATPQQTTPRSATKTKVTVTAKPPEVTPTKPPVVVAPPPVVTPAVVKPPEKVIEKKPQVVQSQPATVPVVKQEEKLKEKPKQQEVKKGKKSTPKKEEDRPQEMATVQETVVDDESILRESPLPIDLDLPLEQDFVFSEKDQIHTPGSVPSFAPYTESAILQGTLPQAFPTSEPLANSNVGGLWGTGLQVPQKAPPQQQQQQPQQFGNATNFVQSLMQYGRSNDLATQLQQQQYMQYYQQSQPMPPGAIDLGDLPWENNPFVEPTRTRSRFEFAKNSGQPFGGDTWKTAPTTDQWASTPFGASSDFGAYAGNDLQQSFRALLPNVNINFSNTGAGSNDPTWGFNQPTQSPTVTSHHHTPSYSINININNHHHTQSYGNNFGSYIPTNKDNTTTTTTASFSFGGNPFAGDSWGF